MGRHNTIAGRMAESAASKGKLFTKLAREIMVAARAGSDINMNAALRSAVNKAKDNSMPKDNIERAIKKGAGELKGMSFEEIMYEGYGPGGSAILVDVLTDNKNRSHPEIRRIFQKHGGNLGEMGVVGWMFKKVGFFIMSLAKVSEEKVFEASVNANVEDISTEDGHIHVYTEPTEFAAVREAFISAEIPFEKAGIEFIPTNHMSLASENYNQALELVEKLEEHDDVQNVYYNFLEENET